MPDPDLLVVGRIHTLDPERPLAGAVLARGGRFAAVGSEDECRRAARRGHRRIDLGRGSAVPGLADAHGHLVMHGRALAEVDCRDAGGAAECAARAGEKAARLPEGSWVRGRGWDESRWRDPAPPTAAALDRAVPGHPVVLDRVDGHASWVNGRALALAGIGPGTSDPPGGRIERDAAGTPTGILVDRARDLVLDLVPVPAAEEMEEAIRRSAAALVRVGITSVHDAGVPGEAWPVLRRLAGDDLLPLRVYGMLDGTGDPGRLRAAMQGWRAAPEVGRLAVRAVKLFADGALGSRGAALLQPYADDPGNAGLLLLEPAELRARIGAIAAAGFQPAIHAIGDRACREVLRALAASGEAIRALRPRVEHLQVLLPEDAPLLAACGAVASMQPVHLASDGPWAAARLGAGTERLRGAYAWRRAASFAPLAFGSDFPVEDPDPRAGLLAAETRRGRGGEVLWPGEPLGRAEALRAFTAGAAFASFAEGRRGTVREGLDADLTAFGEDVMAVPAEDLPRLPVVLTVVGGRVEWQA
ncbi:MAG TPA: amidohydrolase [Anaeromyxobacteraceae bacterium]|nr:amidohydrolase [Anaeromyxobacteraceae bacterium]